jgi:hypothetical protein
MSYTHQIRITDENINDTSLIVGEHNLARKGAQQDHLPHLHEGVLMLPSLVAATSLLVYVEQRMDQPGYPANARYLHTSLKHLLYAEDNPFLTHDDFYNALRSISLDTRGFYIKGGYTYRLESFKNGSALLASGGFSVRLPLDQLVDAQVSFFMSPFALDADDRTLLVGDDVLIVSSRPFGGNSHVVARVEGLMSERHVVINAPGYNSCIARTDSSVVPLRLSPLPSSSS